MAFLTPGKWEERIFKKYDDLLEGTVIPLYDEDVWNYFPQQRWLFNKLQVSQILGYESAPHGLKPPHYPVFSKPIYNLAGEGIGVEKWEKEEDEKYVPGHFWMPYFEGHHISTDVLVYHNEILWSTSAMGEPAEDGKFDRWVIVPDVKIELFPAIKEFIKYKIFSTYVGALNFETLGGKIIEIHSRFTTQWLEFYDPNFLNAVVHLYKDKNPDTAKKLKQSAKGYSIPSFSKFFDGRDLDFSFISNDTRGNNSNHQRKWFRVGYTNYWFDPSVGISFTKSEKVEGKA